MSYSTYYLNLDIFRILEIIDNAADYDPESIVAAKAEIERRDYSDEEWLEIQEEHQRRIRKSLKKKEVKAENETKKTRFLMNFHAVDESASNSVRFYRFVAVILALSIFFELYQHWYLLSDFIYFFEADAQFALMNLINMLLPIIALVFYLRESKMGWIISVVYLLTSALVPLVYIGLFIGNLFKYESFSISSGNTTWPIILGSLFAFIPFVLVILAVYALFRRDTIALFKVDKLEIYTSVIFGVVYSAIVLFST